MYLRWTLADDSIVTAPAYRGAVYVGDFAALSSFITALGDEYLIGRAITDQFTVILDHGERVILEP